MKGRRRVVESSGKGVKEWDGRWRRGKGKERVQRKVIGGTK